MKRYVIPQLPGEWDVARRSGGFLYQRPTTWLVRCVLLSNSSYSTAFKAEYVVILLARPTDWISGRFQAFQALPDIFPYWSDPAPTTVAEAEGPMLQILDLIRDQALPYFDRVGTLAGLTALVEMEAAAHPEDVNIQEELFCLQVVNGDLESALRTAEIADHAAGDDGRDWAIAVGQRVQRNAEAIRRDHSSGISIKRAQADQSRSDLGLVP
ncbi:hypothetical protein Ahu01nite_099710 [Winogradskya humida]|uniref:Uncharacterized protein n=2 Tax=Winogradskya humida TaxID=113566 RepID=A0ABQ4A7N1_9ACTN|nr:hypothetical protein Ahu01nite_099710 [Actinoplanes humidus]